jgi:hypothetical protein
MKICYQGTTDDDEADGDEERVIVLLNGGLQVHP